MLLLQQLRLTDAKYLEGTVNPSNHVSEKAFVDLAKMLDTGCSRCMLFSEADFGNDGHEAEVLFRVGPIGLVSLGGMVNLVA
jgi:L-2,4-diaminobutyric acid acetyltransferase